MTQAESRFKAKLKKYIHSRGGFYSPIPQDGVGAKVGDPDEIVMYKGRWIGVEAKIDTEISGDQILRGIQAVERGGIFAVVHTIEEMCEVLDYVDTLEPVTPQGKWFGDEKERYNDYIANRD